MKFKSLAVISLTAIFTFSFTNISISEVPGFTNKVNSRMASYGSKQAVKKPIIRKEEKLVVKEETLESRQELEDPDKPKSDYSMPDYPANGVNVIGEMQEYIIDEADTLLDVARFYNLGFVEIRAANPDVDPWTPNLGTKIKIPNWHILPRAPQNGIIVNLSEMRLYHFENSKRIESYPIGIGRDGLYTPLGNTTIVRKRANPLWYPTERMREENPDLPKFIEAGVTNPLGDRALYLGWPTFLIHGTNKPWGIGRRVSSGCIRMYPESVKALFDKVPVKTKVYVIDQPVKMAWLDGKLFLEAHPSNRQSYEVEENGIAKTHSFPSKLKKSIIRIAGDKADAIDWNRTNKVIAERRGYPINILK